MAGDGVSLQTNITQLGNLAKSQSKAQQAGAVNPDQARQLEKEDVTPLEKVREAEKAAKKRVDAEKEKAQRRQQRRRRREEKRLAAAAEDDENQDEAGTETRESGLGGLIDTKA